MPKVQHSLLLFSPLCNWSRPHISSGGSLIKSSWNCPRTLRSPSGKKNWTKENFLMKHVIINCVFVLGLNYTLTWRRRLRFYICKKDSIKRWNTSIRRRRQFTHNTMMVFELKSLLFCLNELKINSFNLYLIIIIVKWKMVLDKDFI